MLPVNHHRIPNQPTGKKSCTEGQKNPESILFPFFGFHYFITRNKDMLPGKGNAALFFYRIWRILIKRGLCYNIPAYMQRNIRGDYYSKSHKIYDCIIFSDCYTYTVWRSEGCRLEFQSWSGDNNLRHTECKKRTVFFGIQNSFSEKGQLYHSFIQVRILVVCRI